MSIEQPKTKAEVIEQDQLEWLKIFEEAFVRVKMRVQETGLPYEDYADNYADMGNSMVKLLLFKNPESAKYIAEKLEELRVLAAEKQDDDETWDSLRKSYYLGGLVAQIKILEKVIELIDTEDTSECSSEFEEQVAQLHEELYIKTNCARETEPLNESQIEVIAQSTEQLVQAVLERNLDKLKAIERKLSIVVGMADINKFHRVCRTTRRPSNPSTIIFHSKNSNRVLTMKKEEEIPGGRIPEVMYVDEDKNLIPVGKVREHLMRLIQIKANYGLIRSSKGLLEAGWALDLLAQKLNEKHGEILKGLAKTPDEYLPLPNADKNALYYLECKGLINVFGGIAYKISVKGLRVLAYLEADE